MSMRLIVAVVVVPAVVIGACSSAVPTDDPGVSAVGDHVRLYEGPELEAALGIGYAVGQLGEEYLILGVSLAGSSGGRVTTVDRAGIFVQTPNRRKIPLMTQSEFREVYAKLSAAARRAEWYVPTLLDSAAARRPCFDWFFSGPTDGFARDTLTISSFEVCEGVLFFHIPGGTQAGRWELEIELEESTVEIPFHLESD